MLLYLQCLLLQLVHGAELLDTSEHFQLQWIVSCNTVLAHPFMLQDLSGGRSALGITDKHAPDAVLCRLCMQEY